jgi:hypothetical protein
VSLIVSLVRLLPWPFIGRLGLAFMEITLAVFVVASSVVVGHELKAWREWFWHPETSHPWAPTPRPSPVDAVAPQMPSVVAVAPVVTAAPAIPLVGLPVGLGTGATCRPAAPNEHLVFINKVTSGSDCVRTVERDDGVHLVVDTSPGVSTDFGVIATPRDATFVRVFAPVSWPSPVLVIRTEDLGSAVVLTWESRSPTKLLGVSGQKVDVSVDTAGWPRVMVTAPDGKSRRMYVWTGSSFSAQ